MVAKVDQLRAESDTSASRAARHDRIVDRLRTSGNVLVGDLAAAFFTSEMTIRRDLKALENEGLVRRIHGGSRATRLSSVQARPRCTIDDVWTKIGGSFSPAMKSASTGADGKMYFVPMYNYPWAVMYRKSLFAEKGYQIPKTVDILNMRINGYDFHVSLMAGKGAWTDDKVKNVFTTWRDLLPLHQEGALGRDWQDAAQTLVAKQTGMMTLGSFIGEQFTNPADHDDLDFFAYPEFNSANGTDSIDAPIDGFMMSKSPKNTEGAKQLLQ